MKTVSILSSLALGASAASTAAWDSLPQGERVVPRIDSAPPKDGAKRKEILYGPYTVPASGMVTKNSLTAESPCRNCYVTAMRATLKHPDGREATTSEGAWLHHTVLASIGNGAIWAAGNERPTIRLNSQGKYGFDWASGPLMFTLDLMSEKPEAYDVSMAITYEYIEKDSAEGKLYKPVVMKWNTIGNPKPKPGKIEFKTRALKAGVNGKLLYSIGHMHDGGTNQKLFINGKEVCNSKMFYDKPPVNGSAAPVAAPAAAAAAPAAAAAAPAAAAAAPKGLSGLSGLAGLLGKSTAAAPKSLSGAFPKTAAPAAALAAPKAVAPEASSGAASHDDSGAAPHSHGAAAPAAAPAPVAAAAPAGDGHSHSHRRRDGGGHSHGTGIAGAPHIEQPGACTDFGTVKATDSFTSTAYYDFNLYPTMTHNGEEEALMGNMRVYIGKDS